jgi:CRISPR-associated protein Cmr2
MPDAVLIYTFSPIQSFIAEARRTADLYTGSRILVELAQAIGRAIQDRHGVIIYPADLEGDAPNRLVALVPWADAQTIAEAASDALWDRWRRIAGSARQFISSKTPAPDIEWDRIWSRQVEGLWETYWAAAEITLAGGYRVAYESASKALDAAKRTRVFEAAEEAGHKDSLSGRRAALRTADLDAPRYWKALGEAEQIQASDLRPDGAERLDALGVAKRFSKLAQDKTFPSTSSIASADFVWEARERLDPHRAAVKRLLDSRGYKPHPTHEFWPYDGDLLYMEGLTERRLLESYRLSNPDKGLLAEAKRTLGQVYRDVGWRPALYYAIIALDGDNMGARISACLEEADPQRAHTAFSRSLGLFASDVPAIIRNHAGEPVYSGGDDVLALVPLGAALATAHELAGKFCTRTDRTASAGIAVVHHTSPLGAALRAARSAERDAKQTHADKAAVCVRILKRSGETVQVRSRWEAIGTTFDEVVALFAGSNEHGHKISSKLPYDALRAAYAMPEPDPQWRAEMMRLLKRHDEGRGLRAFDPAAWADRLQIWAATLPGEQTSELANWLGYARFVAQHGGE